MAGWERENVADKNGSLSEKEFVGILSNPKSPRAFDKEEAERAAKEMMKRFALADAKGLNYDEVRHLVDTALKMAAGMSSLCYAGSLCNGWHVRRRTRPRPSCTRRRTR